MDIFDYMGTVDPDVAWCVACLFILFFVGGFGCILLCIIAKHGKVVEGSPDANHRGQISLFKE